MPLRTSTGALDVSHSSHFRLSPLVRVKFFLHRLQSRLHVFVFGLFQLRGRPGPGRRRRSRRPGRRHHVGGRRRHREDGIEFVLVVDAQRFAAGAVRRRRRHYRRGEVQPMFVGVEQRGRR